MDKNTYILNENSLESIDKDQLDIKKENMIWSKKRKPQTEIDQKLNPYAIEWLKTLPENINIEVLIDKFPRIINKIALNWPLSFNRNKYLDELTIRKRDHRQGFPDDVFQDLMKISIYSRTINK